MVSTYPPHPTFDQTCRGNKSRGDPCGPIVAFSAIWPLLFLDGNQVATFVKEVVELPRQEDLFIPGQSGLNIFKGVPNTTVLALRLSFVGAKVKK